MNENQSRSSVFTTKPISALRLADGVSDAIAAALFDGRIAPGEPLPAEGDIAKEFGVSKPVAREALRQLSAAGLILTQQGKVARAKALSGEPMDRLYGYAVRSSLKRLQEANEMRRVMETGIARLAAERRSPDGLEAMQQALKDMKLNVYVPAAFTEADILFHLGIAMATGNSMIRVQMEAMRSVQREVSELFSQRANRNDDDWRATIARHKAIYNAIADGDADRAEDSIRRHFHAADIASLEVVDKLGKGAG